MIDPPLAGVAPSTAGGGGGAIAKGLAQPDAPPTRFNAAGGPPLTQINPKRRRKRPNPGMRYHDETDEGYFARRAAEHRLRVEATGNERARDAHRRMAAAYERQAIRALLDRSLG
jgi:hypothetical protein